VLSPSDFRMLKNLHAETMPDNRTQNWLQNSDPDIIGEEMWSLNSFKLNPVDYQACGNVCWYCPKLKIIAKLEEMLQFSA